MRNASERKIKTQILCSINFSENCDVYEIMWENTVESDRPQMATDAENTWFA